MRERDAFLAALAQREDSRLSRTSGFRRLNTVHVKGEQSEERAIMQRHVRWGEPIVVSREG